MSSSSGKESPPLELNSNVFIPKFVPQGNPHQGFYTQTYPKAEKAAAPSSTKDPSNGKEENPPLQLNSDIFIQKSVPKQSKGNVNEEGQFSSSPHLSPEIISLIGKFDQLSMAGRYICGKSEKLGVNVILKWISQENVNESQEVEQLENEFTILRRIQSKNLVSLHKSFINEQNPQLLIFKAFGDQIYTLEKRVHDPASLGLEPLTWKERTQIIHDIAHGLNFLHELDEPIIHRNINSGGVLLSHESGNLVVKIADFGLALETPEGKGSKWTFDITPKIGSPGYQANEIFLGGKVTKCIDVYALGIIILEVLTGQPAYSLDRFEPKLLAHLNQLTSKSNKSILDLVDPKLGANINAEQFTALYGIGIKCADFNPQERFEIDEVLQNVRWMLKEL